MPPVGRPESRRGWFLLLSLLLVLLSLALTVSGLASRYGFVEAAQYCLLAIAAPALLVLAAPWEGLAPVSRVVRLAQWRNRHGGLLAVAPVVAVALAVEVVWRTPLFVDHLAHDRFMIGLEVVILLPAGSAIWLECLASPPFSPRLTRLGRIVVLAVSMWTVWILAYAIGLSTSDAYPAYRHARGVVSAAADQQITAAVMWLFSACFFAPPAFANLMAWLRSESGPPEDRSPRVGLRQRPQGG